MANNRPGIIRAARIDTHRSTLAISFALLISFISNNVAALGAVCYNIGAPVNLKEAQMLALIDQTREPFVADEAEAVIARSAADRMKAVAKAEEDIKITVDGADDTKIIVPLPARAVAMIYEILEAMANRTPVSLIPHEAELTTQQAADFLNVSRPHLVRQLEDGKLAFRKVGSHRRIRFGDLVAYEKACKSDQLKALDELNADAQRLGLE
ncbi:helix-turn-helix domain-containing protein [Martelella mangrovi]|uniref:Excisionase family DNA binding protein n=1 Tax=Martelella mangrovi TaxID=1397477 RepID=A0ABV2IIS9_9HYPH